MSELIATPSTTATAPQTTPNQPAVPGQTAKVDPAAKADTKASPATPPQLYEVKVNGQMRRYTLEQLKTSAMLGEAATERFETASQKEKKYNQWKETAQKDALQALMDPELGLTKEQIKGKFEAWYKENFIDPETMNEDQKRAARAEREAEELRNEKEEREKRDTDAAKAKEDEGLRQTLQQEIIQTLETSGLPKTRFTANRVAFWMRQNLKQGYNAPQEVIIQQVKDERNSIIESLVAEATPDQLVEMLGDGVVKKLRQYDLAKLKQRFEPQQTPKEKAETPRAGQGRKTMADVEKYFRELRQSKR